MLLKFDGESDGFDWLNVDINKLTLKLSDFGLCRQLSESRASESIMMSVVGTLNWLPPEVKKAMIIDAAKEAPYSKYSDIWACGCVSYYMLNKKTPGNIYCLMVSSIKRNHTLSNNQIYRTNVFR